MTVNIFKIYNLPLRSARSRSAPAKIADLRMQFLKLAPLRLATRKLTQAALEFSKLAPFKLQPSKLDRTIEKVDN